MILEEDVGYLPDCKRWKDPNGYIISPFAGHYVKIPLKQLFHKKLVEQAGVEPASLG
tara:strand:+ start:220 stop:390 length:171 start_codon:yes stop_codon:yes gene_type:complete